MKIKFPTPLFFEMIPYFVSLLSYLDVLVLLIIVFFWDILDFEKDRNATLQLPEDTLMSLGRGGQTILFCTEL